MMRSKPAQTPFLTEETGPSAQNRAAIRNAGMEVFLKSGYLGASVDEIAALAQVSKQTVYKHFLNKKSLFVEIVTRMTSGAGDMVRKDTPGLPDNGEASVYLQEYAFRLLTVVLTPPLMQLRRLVIGEVSRFPELAQILYECGPQRAIEECARVLEQLVANDVLVIESVITAATQFNWLVMAGPLNKAMLLGDKAIPKPATLRRHAAECVRMFLAAYEKRPSEA